MNPVLIWIDRDKIRDEKAALNKYVPLLQVAYTAFLAIGISVTIEDLSGFVNSGRTRIVNLEPFVKKQLLTKAAPAAKFGDVAIQMDTVANMIVIPDLKDVDRAITIVRNSNSLSIRENLLVLTDDVIAKVADADTQIETEYTYYTKTDRSAEFANDLLPIIVSLNALADKHKSNLAISGSPTGIRKVYKADSLEMEYGLSLSDIEAYENRLNQGN